MSIFQAGGDVSNFAAMNRTSVEMVQGILEWGIDYRAEFTLNLRSWAISQLAHDKLIGNQMCHGDSPLHINFPCGANFTTATGVLCTEDATE